MVKIAALLIVYPFCKFEMRIIVRVTLLEYFQ